MANEEHLKILKQGVNVWNKWREENPEIKPDLYEVNLNKASLENVNFTRSDLRNADLTKAYLYNADFTKANLSRTKLIEAYLSEAVLNGAKLENTDLTEARLFKAQLNNADLNKADLYRANFSKAMLNKSKFARASFIGANFSDADLTEAYLGGARLIGTLLNGACLCRAVITGATLYGTARDDWKIDGIRCEYIFFDSESKSPIPKDRNFKPGEFEDLYKHLPTFEYVFEHGLTPIDAFIIDEAVQAINIKSPNIALQLDSFHSRGLNPRAVFTVLKEEYAEKALNQVKTEYEFRIKELEVERDTLEKCFIRAMKEPRIYIESVRRLEMSGEKYRDKYEIEGQTGAVGPGAQAHHINFNQVWNQLSSDTDIARLPEELTQLRLAMKKESESLEHDTAVGEIAAAEAASQANDGPKALEHLKKAGTWAFKVAENIGTTIAAEALKKAMGL